MKKIILAITLLLLLSGYACSYPADDIHIITDSDYFSEVKGLINGAQKSIYLSIYLISYHLEHKDSLPNQLLEELVKAKERGVDVKVLLDQGMTKTQQKSSNDPAYFYLKSEGIDVNYDLPSVKLHEKLIVIDEYITVIGSHNWSKSALDRNRETSVVVKSAEFAGEFINRFKKTPVSPPRYSLPESGTDDLYVPYLFITDPGLGIKLSDVRMKFYLYLLMQWQKNGYKTVYLDYDEAAESIGLSGNTKKEYRTYINTLLRIFNKKYGLLTFKLSYNNPAEINLFDYRNKDKPLKPNKKNCFAVPGNFFEFDWIDRLSINAKFFYFINLIETKLSGDPEGWWSHSRKYLRKKYGFTSYQLTHGSTELNRFNLIEVKYGPLEYPFTEKLQAPRYHILELYSWAWLEDEFKRLDSIYGQENAIKARDWAGVILAENNVYIVEKLLNYSDIYGKKSVQYAVDRVAEKRIGNPKRSFPYLEGIILKENSKKR